MSEVVLSSSRKKVDEILLQQVLELSRTSAEETIDEPLFQGTSKPLNVCRWLRQPPGVRLEARAQLLEV